jgi:phospholipase/carboxylesterase
MRYETWARLEVCITGGQDRQGGGTGPVVILLHGFGAPGDDLVALWRMLDVPKEIRFLFPAAPLSLNLGFGQSRAWWLLDIERLTQARAKGQWDKLTREIPPGLQSAHDQLLEFLGEAKHHLHLTPQELVLGGFSQGAMLACDLALRTNLPVGGLVFLSGSIISRESWFSSIPQRKGLSVFQSHGTDDPLLSCAVARQLRDAFIAGGLEVDWNEFPGGHEIPLHVLDQLSRFLRRVFAYSKDLPGP